MKTSRRFPTAFTPGACFPAVPPWARCALISCVVASGSIPLAAAPDPMPRRPATVFASYKGNMEPIVSATWNNRPVVLENNQRITVADHSGVSLNLGRAFAAGRVEIREPEALGWVKTYMADNVAFSQHPVSIQFKATLVSDTDLSDVFVVIVVFDVHEAPNELAVSSILVADVGRLTAGKPTRFSSQFPPIANDRQRTWTTLVFSGGLEVRSTGVPDLLAQFFDVTERHRHSLLMQQRVHGTDAAIEVFRQFPLELSEDLKAAYSGQTVQARLTINLHGSVSAVALVDLQDPKLVDELRAQFGWWLFLPAIKDGAAVPRQAILPLRL